MTSKDFVLGYVTACTDGKLPLSDCGPVWQLGIIAGLLVAAVLSLVVLRALAHTKSARV